MNAPAAKRMTVPEFLAWAEGQTKGRYELFRGEILAMAPERAEHAKAKFSIARALDAAIKHAGLPCEAFVDGLAVVIDDLTSYEPDALVNCGEAVPPDALSAPSPIIVVEVVSPGSVGLDKETKLADYFRLDSVVHYLIVELKRRNVLHYRRGTDGVITVSILSEGTIALDPPGLTIAVADCFS
jgi:Uma2 family endonuclease